MNRQEFCDLITNRKEQLDLSWLDLTINTYINASSLRKIFSGTTNFFVESALKIILGLNAVLAVKNAQEQIEINNEAVLICWAKKSMQSAGFSLNKFKDEVGLTRVALTANYKGESKMRIDTFLKWAEATGYQVEIRDK